MSRWTAETEILLAREVYAFADNGQSLPGYDEDDPDVRRACREGARQFLTLLADAGLLVPASEPNGDSQPAPRVWVKTENPLDVQAVVDPYGETWKREPELPGLPPSPRDTWVNAVGNRFHWYGLVGIRGPLTEVDE